MMPPCTQPRCRRRLSSRFAAFSGQFFEPFIPVLTVNDSAEEPERLSDVAAIEADVLARGPRVFPDPLAEVAWLAEDVGRMAGLWDFDDHTIFKIEDVFVSEQIHCSGAI